jgi:hypothetical protein
MIDFDNLREKAEEFVEDHADQIDHGIDQAAKMAGKKYGHGQQIEQGADKLKDLLPGGEADERRGPPNRRSPGGQRPAASKGHPNRPARPDGPGRPRHRQGG